MTSTTHFEDPDDPIQEKDLGAIVTDDADGTRELRAQDYVPQDLRKQRDAHHGLAVE